MGREIWKINKFDGGINDATDPKDIKSNEYTTMVDCNVSKQGVVKTLGQAVKSQDILPTVVYGDLFPGKGFYNYYSDYTFNPDSSIGVLSTVITQEQDTAALDGDAAEIFLDPKGSCLWLFDTAPTGGTLSLTVKVNNVAITNTFNVVTGSNWQPAGTPTNFLDDDVFFNYNDDHFNNLDLGLNPVIANMLVWELGYDVSFFDTISGAASGTYGREYSLIPGNVTNILIDGISQIVGSMEILGPKNSPNHMFIWSSLAGVEEWENSNIRGNSFWHSLPSGFTYNSSMQTNADTFEEYISVNDGRFIWGLSDNTTPYYGIGYHIFDGYTSDDNVTAIGSSWEGDKEFSFIYYPAADFSSQLDEGSWDLEITERVFALRTRLSLWSKIIQEINSFAGSGVTNKFEAEFANYKYLKNDGTDERNSVPEYTNDIEDGIIIRTNSGGNVSGINGKSVTLVATSSSLQGGASQIADGGTASVGSLVSAVTATQTFIDVTLESAAKMHSGEMVRVSNTEWMRLLDAQLLNPFNEGAVTWNVERAQLGDSAATHSDGAAVHKYDIHPLGDDNTDLYTQSVDFTEGQRAYGTSYNNSGDAYFTGGSTGAVQITKLYLSGEDNTSDTLNISLNGVSAIAHTGPVPGSPFTLSGSHSSNATTIAAAINGISGVSSSSAGGVITVTSGTTGTAGEFSIETNININSVMLLNNIVRQGISEEFTALINKSDIIIDNSGPWHTNPGDGLTYKLTYFNLHSKLQNNWISDMSDKLQWTYAEGASGDTVTNGGFATDSDWVKGTGWTINTGTGKAVCDASQTSESAIRQGGNILFNTPGITYKITVTTTVTSGKWRLIIDCPEGPAVATTMTDEAVTGESYYLTTHARGNNASIAFVGSQDFAGTLDNISCSQVQDIPNDPLMWDEASRLRLVDREFRLNNKTKCFDYFDISNWFSSDYVTAWNWQANSFTDLQGMEIVPNEKTWTHSIPSDTTNDTTYHTTTKNGLWIGTHSDYNDSANFDTHATMRLRFDMAADAGGIDWIGTARFYAAAVYDDGGEGLPAHKFTIGAAHNSPQADGITFGVPSGDDEGELNGDVLRVFAAIKPAANGETIFGDKRITGIRLYYTHSEEGFETFWSLGVIDFRKGFVKANEVLTVDDTAGNSNLVVWRDSDNISSIGGGSETDEGNSVLLYDITANKVYVEFLSMPKLESFETINGYSPFNSTISVRYKTHCIGGRRSFVGNIAVKDITGALVYKNDTMVVSPVNQLDTFPYPHNVLDLDISDGDEIISLNNIGDRILQFKRKMLYIVDISTGIPSEFYVESKHRFKGIIDQGHVIETSEGVFWFNEFGAYFYDGEEIKDLHMNTDDEKAQRRISEDVWRDFVSEVSLIGYNPKTKDCFVIRKREHNLITDGDCYIYNLNTDSWTFGYGKFFHGFNKSMTNIITFGENSKLGFLYNGPYGSNHVVDNTPQEPS